MPALLYAVVVVGASVINPPSGSLAPTGPLGLVGVDKWIHGVTYATFVALLCYALWTATSRPLPVAVVVAIVYGAGVEIVQSFVPLRAFSLLDVLANAIGAVLSGLVLWSVLWLRSRQVSS